MLNKVIILDNIKNELSEEDNENLNLDIKAGGTIVLGEENEVLPGKGLVKFIKENNINRRCRHSKRLS